MLAKPLVALFIDAENASSRHAQVYVDHCRAQGRLTIARCYGSAAALKKWEKAMAEHHIMPMLTPPSAAKQNASDFALTIDAVAALHRDMFDIAVIASSDADFTQLAIHVREYGKTIAGIGENKASKSLQSAFDSYVIVPAGKASAAAKPKAARAATSSAVATAMPAASKPAASAIDVDWLRQIFKTASKDGKATDLQALGRALAAARADYKKGYRTLDNFLKKSGIFEIENRTVRLTG